MTPQAAASRRAPRPAREALNAAGPSDATAGSLRVLLAALFLLVLLLGEALGGAGASSLTRPQHGGPAIDETSQTSHISRTAQLRQGALSDAARLLMVVHAPTQARTAGQSAGDALPPAWHAFHALERQASPAPSATVEGLAAAAAIGRYHARAPPARA